MPHEGEAHSQVLERALFNPDMANLRTRILYFGGFDSSIILISKGVILMSIGDLPEMSSQQILVGIIKNSREIGRSIWVVEDQCKETGGRRRGLLGLEM